MSYIGRNVDKISNIEILDNITFDGSSSYSITKSSVAFVPNSAQSLLISIDGVVQATNFTVSTSTIDFGVAVPSTSTCDFFLHYGTGVLFTPADGTVTEAKIGSGAVTSAKLGSDVTQGITQTDQWRLTADTNQNTDADVTTNWERVDDPNWDKIGTGMTESSGIFTFPATGYWLVINSPTIQTGQTDTFSALETYISSDSGSSYNQSDRTTSGTSTEIGTTIAVSKPNMLKVTDTSTFRIKFTTQSFGGTSTRLRGDTNYNYTVITFIKLGDI